MKLNRLILLIGLLSGCAYVTPGEMQDCQRVCTDGVRRVFPKDGCNNGFACECENKSFIRIFKNE